jgi:flavin-dependent thymidylate synthase
MRNTYKTKIEKSMEALPIYFNNSVDIIFDACRSCYAITKEMNYEEKKQYISKRVACGHDSILEHSNIMILIKNFHHIFDQDLVWLLTAEKMPCKYLQIRTAGADKSLNHSYRDSECINILIQGSIRGFKHFLKNAGDLEDNVLFSQILNALYDCTVYEFFCDMKPEAYDFIEPDRFIKELYNPFDPYTAEMNCNSLPVTDEEKDKIRVVNFDPDENIYDLISEYGFTKEDTIDMSTITVLFENMSRTATHQLVRHRNAITQESQRYVDYSNAGFTVPKIDYLKETNQRFQVKIGNSSYSIQLEQLGRDLCGIYKQLRDQGLKKEDARSFLPSNVQCHKLYMTFTRRSFNKFIELRTDIHAQSEIREYALLLQDKICREESKPDETVES